MKKLGIYFIVLLANCLYAQTSADGEVKIYSREAYLNTFGYYSPSFLMPAYYSGTRFDLFGIAYTHNYDITNLGNIPLSNNNEIRFLLKGSFRIGASMGNKSISDPSDLYPSNEIKYYGISLDPFSLFMTPQFTQILSDGYAITFELGIGIFNIGGDAMVLENGDLKKHTLGVIKIVPVIIKPSLFFDFGNSGVGIGAYLNPLDIVNFIISSEELYNDQKGLQTNSDLFKRYEFQIVFTF